MDQYPSGKEEEKEEKEHGGVSLACSLWILVTILFTENPYMALLVQVPSVLTGFYLTENRCFGMTENERNKKIMPTKKKNAVAEKADHSQ